MSGQKHSKTYEEYLASIPKIKAKDLTGIVDDSMVQVSMQYAKQYQDNPKGFISCFIKYPSVRTNCAFIIQAYKHNGAFKECLQTGKDFTEYANRQPVEEKWKRVLAEVLLIIYSIINA